MNIFPVFHLPKLCITLIVAYFVFVFHVVTLAILLFLLYLSISSISNRNVFVHVTLAYVFQASIVTV